MDLAGVVLAGGTGARLGGVDKARVRWRDRRLLEHVLDALDDLPLVAVVGAPVPDLAVRGVRFVREEPPGGGPAAGLLAGVDAVADHLSEGGRVVVVAVDMPGVTAATVTRLRGAAAGRDGAVLLGRGGRRQLAMVLDPVGLRDARPPGTADGLPVHRLLADLDLAEVAGLDDEGVDVDTWADLEALGAVPVQPVTGDDWERWARLRLAALADAPEAFGSRLADWADAGEDRWRARLAAPGATCWIASLGPDLADAGMVAVQPDERGRWWLLSMYVDPSARGRGVADALVGAVVTHVRRTGAVEVRLHVREANAVARAAYERLGFVAVGRVEDPGEPEVEMVRALGS